jgi:hypothetical protein
MTTEAEQQKIVDRLKRQRHELMLPIAKLDEQREDLAFSILVDGFSLGSDRTTLSAG